MLIIVVFFEIRDPYCDIITTYHIIIVRDNNTKEQDKWQAQGQEQ